MARGEAETASVPRAGRRVRAVAPVACALRDVGRRGALSEADVALVLALAADDRERDRLVDLAALRLDGLLVVHGHGDPQLVESLVAAGVPTVFAGRTSTTTTQDLWWVDSDNAAEGVTSFDVGSLAEDDVLARVLLRLPRLPRPQRIDRGPGA